MIFNCAQSELLNALNFIINAVAVKPQNQVLGGIYLKAEDDTLEIQATDYSIGMKGELLADVIEPGEIVVLGKKFFEVVRNMPADTLSINYDRSNSLLEVACAKTKFSINTLNTEEFPKIAVQNATFSFKINGNDLKELITKSIFACATEESQPIYTGCLVESDGEKISLAATNKHRLAIAKGVLAEPSEKFRFVIPRDALRTIAEMLTNESDELIKVDYSDRKVAFTIGSIYITARLIDGDYPDYNRVVPSAPETFLTMNVNELRRGIERASIIAREDFNKKIIFNVVKGNGVEISANSAEYGSIEDKVEFTAMEGPDVKVAFNYIYFIDALKLIRTETCRIALKGYFDPMDLREEKSDDFIYVLTPLRV